VRRAAIAGVAVAAILIGCGDDGGDRDGSSPRPEVQAQDFRFGPATTRVPAGATVTWRNSGRTEHTVKGPGFFSRAVAPGASWSHRFAKPGSYDYVCTLHSQAMRGRVVVGD
jgi:plastocyanin